MGLRPNDIRDAVNKKYGKGASFIAADQDTLRLDVIPTGSIKLDTILGVGGVPRGRIIEIYGPESSGKTTLCQHIIAEAQSMGGVCAFVDMEHALDLEYAIKCGIDDKTLLTSQPDTGEQALEIAEIYIRQGCAVVVVDSVAALVPRAEIEGEMGDSHMGKQARLMSQACRKLSGIVKESNCVLIFTNQLRHKIGVMFGSPETTTGGMALRFYASMRIDLRKRTDQKDGNEVIGNKVQAKIKKNKVASPFKMCEFDIAYDLGIDRIADIVSLINDGHVSSKLIELAGSWYKIHYDENNNKLDTPIKFQGQQNMITHLKDNPKLCDHVENLIRRSLCLPLIVLEDTC